MASFLSLSIFAVFYGYEASQDFAITNCSSDRIREPWDKRWCDDAVKTHGTYFVQKQLEEIGQQFWDEYVVVLYAWLAFSVSALVTLILSKWVLSGFIK